MIKRDLNVVSPRYAIGVEEPEEGSPRRAAPYLRATGVGMLPAPTLRSLMVCGA